MDQTSGQRARAARAGSRVIRSQVWKDHSPATLPLWSEAAPSLLAARDRPLRASSRYIIEAYKSRIMYHNLTKIGAASGLGSAAGQMRDRRTAIGCLISRRCGAAPVLLAANAIAGAGGGGVAKNFCRRSSGGGSSGSLIAVTTL